jgi:hypothetical protein
MCVGQVELFSWRFGHNWVPVTDHRFTADGNALSRAAVTPVRDDLPTFDRMNRDRSPLCSGDQLRRQPDERTKLSHQTP